MDFGLEYAPRILYTYAAFIETLKLLIIKNHFAGDFTMKMVISIIISLMMISFNQNSLSKPASTITVDSGYVNIDGGRLFYEAAGSGDYIVLLHDGIVHREIWDYQFLEFAKNYRVIRYDRRLASIIRPTQN